MARHCLVTGGNRGLGLAFTRRLLERGEQVIATARQPGRALELNELAGAYPGHLHVLPLDLARDASIDECARELRALDGRLDLVIHNAGMLPSGERFGALASATVEQTFRTNAVGPLLLSERLASLFGRGGVIAMISSTVGSIAETQQFRTPSYAISKAALNMITRLLAAQFADAGVTVVALHPGWVRTDMGGERAPIAPLDAAAALLGVLDEVALDRTGMFLDHEGRALPW